MDNEQLKRHIKSSDLTALEKRYLEGLVEARTPREGMRLIDAEALKKRIGVVVNSMIEGDETETELKFFGMIDHVLESSVDDTPTIEAEPVRHGRWVECDYKHMEHGFVETDVRAGLYCSECRTGFKKSELRIKLHCPNCGAKMENEV